MKKFLKRLFCKHYFSTWLYDYQPLIMHNFLFAFWGRPRSKWQCTDCGKKHTCKTPKNKQYKDVRDGLINF